MGTGTNDSNLAEEAKKRQYVVARLFRGLIDILRTKYDNLTSSLISHVRTFDKESDDSDWIYAETSGFWRMLLELTFQIYASICYFVGVLLVALLVCVAWPVRFLLEVFSGSINASRQNAMFNQITPTLDDNHDPDDGKVVRRVVYEETKVDKK
jgi:hypothetical protein